MYFGSESLKEEARVLHQIRSLRGKYGIEKLIIFNLFSESMHHFGDHLIYVFV